MAEAQPALRGVGRHLECVSSVPQADSKERPPRRSDRYLARKLIQLLYKDDAPMDLEQLKRLLK